MTLTSQEHYEMMEFFDRQHLNLRLDKEPKETWAKRRVYQNDEANSLFLAFREGVAYGKAISASEFEHGKIAGYNEGITAHKRHIINVLGLQVEP